MKLKTPTRKIRLIFSPEAYSVALDFLVELMIDSDVVAINWSLNKSKVSITSDQGKGDKCMLPALAWKIMFYPTFSFKTLKKKKKSSPLLLFARFT